MANDHIADGGKKVRLIDANLVKRVITEVIADNSSEELFIKVLAQICKVLDRVPTVDAVEVVRCKDCEFWKSAWKSCPMSDDTWSACCSNDFCSRGKRKANK